MVYDDGDPAVKQPHVFAWPIQAISGIEGLSSRSLTYLEHLKVVSPKSHGFKPAQQQERFTRDRFPPSG